MVKKRYSVSIVLLLTACILLCWVGALFPNGNDDRTLEIYGINIGQGDAALLVFPHDGVSRKTMLIDCGRRSGGGKVASLLSRLGIGRIDIAIHSHNDADHVGGFATLGVPITTQYHRYTIPVGEVIYDGGGATVTCVAADGRIMGSDHAYNGYDENTLSAVVLVKYLGFDYLSGGDLTGPGAYHDMESPLGAALAAMGKKIDVLKVHHHGSRHSTGSGFLSSIGPEFALIFVGSNGYDHPTWDALWRLSGCTRIYQTGRGSGGTASNVTVANGQIHVVTDGLTFSFSNEGLYSTPFNDGPYMVDEYVGFTPTPENTATPTITPTPTTTPAPITMPPHLLITEAAVSDYSPEDHIWFELYLPPGAAPVDLSELYWVRLDHRAEQLATNGPLTLSIGDVVIIHTTSGTDESDATGKGENGWWDVYISYDYWYPDDMFIISNQESDFPSPAGYVDAVAWSDDSGWMDLWVANDLNYVISCRQWGDPIAGMGRFAADYEAPAIGDINDGFAQRMDTRDTNSVTDWIISPTHSQGLPQQMAPIRVNFQLRSSQIPSGYVVDDGSVYETHGAYGWR